GVSRGDARRRSSDSCRPAGACGSSRVSRKLPAVTGNDLIAALAARGWYVKRVRGSHHILRHPTIPVPVHGGRPIKRGTLLNILRTAGVSRDEFVRLLGD